MTFKNSSMRYIADLSKLFLSTTIWTACLLGLIAESADARASRCATIMPSTGREIILNKCNRCQIVNITRKRPGNAVPVSRSFNVQANSNFTLPFRGPGRSRITSILPCKGEPGAARNLIDSKKSQKVKKTEEEKCITIKKLPNVRLQLVNSCKVCMAALIERHYSNRKKGIRYAYKVFPNLPLELKSLGASQVGLLAEVNCP